MIDHIVLFTLREGVSSEDAGDLLSSVRDLRERVPGIVDLSAGENFSERAGGYTHGLFVRFRTADDLRAYIQHPDHQAVVEKLDALTDGRLVVDYEHDLR